MLIEDPAVACRRERCYATGLSRPGTTQSQLTAALGRIGTVGMTPMYQIFGTKEEKRA